MYINNIMFMDILYLCIRGAWGKRTNELFRLYYRWFYEKVSFSVHSFNEHYLYIPQNTGSSHNTLLNLEFTKTYLGFMNI